MIRHIQLGDNHFTRIRQLKTLLNKNEIALAGNSKLKIFGKLRCHSGKRMKTQNRVFFSSITEAYELGYRPCGHCMRIEFKFWKIQSE